MAVAVAFVSGVWRQRSYANLLTGLRPVLAIPVIWLAAEQMFFYAFWVAAFAAATDILDGWLARTRNHCTPLGRVADPLADKAFVLVTLLPTVFIHQEMWVFYLWLLTLVYDGFNTYHRRHEIARAILNLPGDQADLPVSLLSKGKTVLLFAVVLYCYLPPAYVDPDWLRGLTLVTFAFVAGSFLHNYIRITWR